jgi:gustatory receptor
LLLLLYFLRLAKTWPQMMVQWHDVEKKLANVLTENEKRAMHVKIQRTALFAFILIMFEHILYASASVFETIDCPRIKSVAEAYFVRNFPQVFSIYGYSHFLGIWAEFVDTTSHFVWSFTDLFIVLFACGLSGNFQLINDRIMADQGKVRKVTNFLHTQIQPIISLKFTHSDYWKEYRSCYRSVSELVAFVDEKISFITIVSLANNLFFICQQLLNSPE